MQRYRDKQRPNTDLDACTPRVMTSDELFQGSRRIEISHQGEIYRLQITRQGKLILTK